LFATTALRKGISLATVQKILGHDRLQTTAIELGGGKRDGAVKAPTPS
jgi:hypothetical protein